MVSYKKEEKALIGLTLSAGIGASLAGRLLRHFGSAVGVFEATKDELLAIEGIGPSLAGRLAGGLPGGVDAVLQELERGGMRLWSRGSQGYPTGLERLSSPPSLLYVRGDAPRSEKLVAVVGTRQPDEAGLALTRRVVGALVEAGFGVVSGGALGIDAAAHEAVLESDGWTGCVLGSGLSRPYPSQHRGLFQRIVASGGLLISEYAPQTMPERGHFPQRNRLICALCQGVVVVQCGRQSGALHTAQEAMRMEIPVFTFPGRPGEELAAGPHRLIRRGALLVESGEEIAALLADGIPQATQLELWSSPVRQAVVAQTTASTRPPDTASALSQEAKEALGEEPLRCLTLLAQGPLHIDEIAQQMRYSIPQLSPLLLELELGGWIASRPGQEYECCRRRHGER